MESVVLLLGVAFAAIVGYFVMKKTDGWLFAQGQLNQKRSKLLLLGEPAFVSALSPLLRKADIPFVFEAADAPFQVAAVDLGSDEKNLWACGRLKSDRPELTIITCCRDKDYTVLFEGAADKVLLEEDAGSFFSCIQEVCRHG